MSLFRVVLAFVMAGVAGVFAVNNPERRTLWIGFSAVCLVIAFFRLRTYRQMKNAAPTSPDETKEQF